MSNISTCEAVELVRNAIDPYSMMGISADDMVYASVKRHMLSLFEKPEGECLQQLQDICTAFNSHRLDTTAVAQILLFEEVPQVFEYIKQQIWCEEVFYEDFGCSYSWLEKLCQSFTNGSFFRYRLLHFLNDRVGCLAG